MRQKTAKRFRIGMASTLSALVLAALIGAIHHAGGWRQIARFWSDLDIPLAALALTLLAGSHFVRAERLLGVLPKLKPGLRLTVYSISTWHTALNNLLPMRSGELSLPLLVRRRLMLPWTHSISTLFVIRLLDLCTLFLVWSMVWLFDSFGALGSMAIIAGWILAMRHALASYPYLARYVPEKFRPEDSQLELRNPLGTIVLTLLAWFLKFAALLMLAQAALPASPSIWASSVLAGELSSISPVHGPAGMGSYEAAFLAPALLANFEWRTVFPVALNLHLCLLLSSIFLASLLQLFVTALSLFLHRSLTGKT